MPYAKPQVTLSSRGLFPRHAPAFALNSSSGRLFWPVLHAALTCCATNRRNLLSNFLLTASAGRRGSASDGEAPSRRSRGPRVRRARSRGRRPADFATSPTRQRRDAGERLRAHRGGAASCYTLPIERVGCAEEKGNRGASATIRGRWGDFVSRLSRSWPIAGRAFARASLTPKLLAVLAFSFVVAGAGVLTYAQALPGLAAQSPLLQMMAGQGRSSGGYVPWGPLGRTERTVDGELATASADGSLAQTEGGMAPRSRSRHRPRGRPSRHERLGCRRCPGAFPSHRRIGRAARQPRRARLGRECGLRGRLCRRGFLVRNALLRRCVLER